MSDDTIVLVPKDGPRPGPRRRARPNRETGVAAIVSAFLLLLSVTTLGPPPPPAAPRPAAIRPVYPGAQGRLLLTVPANGSSGELGPNPIEQLFELDLTDRSLRPGPMIPPVPGPPFFEPLQIGRGLSVGPRETPASGEAAFLAEGWDRVFLYLVPTASGLASEAAAAAESEGYTWTGSGALAIARQDGPRRVTVWRADPRTGTATDRVGTVPRPFGSLPSIFAAGEDVYVIRGTDGAVIRVADGRRLLRGRFVLSAAPAGSGEVLVARRVFEPGTRRTRGFAVWTPGTRPEPVRYPFVPQSILGWSPDGGRYAATGWFEGRPGLWVLRSIGSGPATLVAPLDLNVDVVSSVAFSGDGDAVFFVRGFTLQGFDLVRSAAFQVPLPEGFGGLPSDVAWAP